MKQHENIHNLILSEFTTCYYSNQQKIPKGHLHLIIQYVNYNKNQNPKNTIAKKKELINVF
jgi:hypothetical protein